MNMPTLETLRRLKSTAGTEALVYLDDQVAYRVTNYDKHVEERYIYLMGLNVPELVKIYDVQRQGNHLIVKMQRLYDLHNSVPRADLDRYYENCPNDEVDEAEEYLPSIVSPMLRQMIAAQIRVARALNEESWDFGPHNVMVDGDGELVVIDPC